MGIFREACWPKIKISTIFPTGGSGDISEHLLTITAVHTEKEISSEKKTKITGAVCLKTATLTPLFAADKSSVQYQDWPHSLGLSGYLNKAPLRRSNTWMMPLVWVFFGGNSFSLSNSGTAPRRRRHSWRQCTKNRRKRDNFSRVCPPASQQGAKPSSTCLHQSEWKRRVELLAAALICWCHTS